MFREVAEAINKIHHEEYEEHEEKKINFVSFMLFVVQIEVRIWFTGYCDVGNTGGLKGCQQ